VYILYLFVYGQMKTNDLKCFLTQN